MARPELGGIHVVRGSHGQNFVPAGSLPQTRSARSVQAVQSGDAGQLPGLVVFSVDESLNTGVVTFLENLTPVDLLLRGDADGSGSIDIADLMAVISVIMFIPDSAACSDACDTNDDGALSISDVIALAQRLWYPGIWPPIACAPDTTPDTLFCDLSSCP